MLHANFAGKELLEPGGPLSTASHRLFAADRGAEAALCVAIAAAIDGDAAALGRTGAVIPLRDFSGQLYAVHVLPLGSDLRAAGNPSAAVAVFVRKASMSPIAVPEALARAYHLTPTELRVLLAVVEIGGGPEVADALGIAESTVKFHLRRLFEKPAPAGRPIW